MARKVAHDTELVAEQVSEEGFQEPATPEPDWPDRKLAAIALKTSQMTVRRLEKEGLLTPHRLPGSRGGKIVFDPEQVEGLAGTVQLEGASIDEMNAQTLVSSAVNLSRQSAAHAERLLQLVEDPANNLQQMLREENQDLRKRIRELEEDRIKLFEMMEEARSKQHERELAQLQWASQNQRKDAVMQFVIDQGPRLTQQIVASGAAPQMLDSLSKLAHSLKPNQIGQLMGILDPEQALTLSKVLDTVGRETAPDQSPAKTHSLLEE